MDGIATLRNDRRPVCVALAGIMTQILYESSDSFVASAAASIATGGSEPVPGRELHPLKSSAFYGALLHQMTKRGLFVSRLERGPCVLAY